MMDASADMAANVLDEDINVKLFRAIRSHSEDETQCLLDQGADPNCTSPNNLVDGRAGPLHSAVRLNNVKIVKILLEHGADVNLEDEDGDTPLFSAIYKETPPEIRKLLFEYGAVKNHKNKTGETPLTKMLDNFMRWGYKFSQDTLLDSLDACDDFRQQSASGMSLIHFVSTVHSCAEDGDARSEDMDHLCVAFLTRLLQNGIPVNLQDHLGRTALHSAASACCYPSIKYLLDNGIEVSVKDMKGQTAIHQVVRKPNGTEFEKSLDLLLQHGCDINELDSFGRTALHYTASSEYTNKTAFKILQEKGAIIIIKDKAKLSPLHLSVLPTVFVPYRQPEDEYPKKSDVLSVISYLVENGVDIDDTDGAGLTALHYAVRERNTDVVKLLLELGADPNQRTKTGESALHRATIDTATFDALMDFCDVASKNADINMQDNFGSTPSHWAVWYLEPLVIRRLNSEGARLDIKDHTGKTVPDLACFLKHTNVYEELGIIYDREVYPPIPADPDPLLSQLSTKHILETLKANEQTDVQTYDDGSSDNLDTQSMLEKWQQFPNFANEQDNTQKFDGGGSNKLDTETKVEKTQQFLIPFANEQTDAQNFDDGVSDNLDTQTELEKIQQFSTPFVNEENNEQNIDDVSSDKLETQIGVEKLRQFSTPFANEQDDAQNSDHSSSDNSDSMEDGESDWSDNECSGQDYLYPECPFLMTIYNEEKVMDMTPWKIHLHEHKAALQTFVKLLLKSAPANMALYQETEENHEVAMAVKELLVNVSERINAHYPLFKCEVTLAGSWNEGTKTTIPGEFDYNWRLINFSQAFLVEEGSSASGSGFVRFRLKEDMQESEFVQFVEEHGYLDGRKVIQEFYNVLNGILLQDEVPHHNSLYIRKYLKIDKGSISQLSFRWVGPLYKDMLVEVDIVPSILPENFTPRSIKLDSKLLPKPSQNRELDVVLKTPSEEFVRDWNTFFRISVAKVEALVIMALPAAVRKGFSLVKALRDTLYMPQVFDDRFDSLVESLLSTYILKTCFLHSLEAAMEDSDETLQIPADETSKEVTIDWARRIVQYLETSIEKSSLPCFFMPGVNLLLNESTTVCNDLYIFKAEGACLAELVRVGTGGIPTLWPLPSDDTT